MLGRLAQRLLILGAVIHLLRLAYDAELLRVVQLFAVLLGLALAAVWLAVTVRRDPCSARLYASIALWFLTPWGLYIQLRQVVGEAMSRLRGGPQTHAPLLSPPFAGCWRVVNGGVTKEESHSWGLISQRYAYDLVREEDYGKLERTCDYADVGSWATFGAPILAAAPGRVVAAVDGVEDNAPGLVRLGARHLAGNHVVIDHGGTYTLYAHLRRGSVRVRPGQWVEAGTPIGEAGNSGMSSAPHLHFQLMDKPNYLATRSIPPTMLYASAEGERRGAPRKGETVCGGGQPTAAGSGLGEGRPRP